MKLHTYLNYGGNCAQAFRFYEQHLGAKIKMMMTQAEAPPPNNVSPERKNDILRPSLQHAARQIRHVVDGDSRAPGTCRLVRSSSALRQTHNIPFNFKRT